jgi:transcriptional regulator with XRE-family HTH domain
MNVELEDEGRPVETTQTDSTTNSTGPSTTLREARRRRDWNQTDLAVAAGLQPALVCRYERGVKPGQRNARRLAEALGCAVEELYPEFATLRRY